MPTITARMTGMDSLSLKVKYLKDAAKSGLKLSVSEAAGLFEQEAKLQVPVLSGNLRDHIHTEVVVDEPEKQVSAVSPLSESGNEYGFDPPYARRIEFGFVGADRLGRVYNQAPQPYMRPSYDMHKDEAVKVIKDGVFSSITEAMNAVAAKRNK